MLFKKCMQATYKNQRAERLINKASHSSSAVFPTPPSFYLKEKASIFFLLVLDLKCARYPSVHGT